MAVIVSLAAQGGSLPVAWQLYLPKEWCEDEARRQNAGVPQQTGSATKPAIALAQIERLLDQGAPRHRVLADAGYGTETAFRERLSELGLAYVVGVTGQVNVCAPGHAPLPPTAYSGRGNVPTRQRLGEAAHQRPQSMKGWRTRCRPSNGTQSSGEKAATSPCAVALPGFGCAQRTATSSATSYGPSSGRSSSGPRATRIR